MGVARVIPFAPKHQNIHVSSKHNLKNLVDECKKILLHSKGNIVNSRILRNIYF